jgi:glycosyltransferase involved in cell wall biosynthesis
MTAYRSGVGIHQILVSASSGDAITNMARQLRALLRQVGPSEIYAWHVAPELHDDVLHLSTYQSRHARNVLVVHSAIGQPEVYDFLIERRESLVLVYHNVTPARYFEPYSRDFAELLDLGRREVEMLRPRVVRAIADSHYNARELEAMGYREVVVVPPSVDFRHLAAIEPRAETMEHLTGLQTEVLLCVAQLMPHKRPDFLVQMIHIASTYMDMGAVLLMVGHQRLANFSGLIREQMRQLRTSGVRLVGAVDDADLAAMFRVSSAVVCASEHEGFCLPLVEAMTFDTPIIARACAAIPETVGDAGLLLPESHGPTLFAEAVAELLSNRPARDELAARGRRRVVELETRAPGVAMLGALAEVV